jgi:cell division protein FtsB
MRKIKMKKIFSLLLILGLLIMPVRKCSAETITELKNRKAVIESQIKDIDERIHGLRDAEAIGQLVRRRASLTENIENIEKDIEDIKSQNAYWEGVIDKDEKVGVGECIAGLAYLEYQVVGLRNGQEEMRRMADELAKHRRGIIKGVIGWFARK